MKKIYKKLLLKEKIRLLVKRGVKYRKKKDIKR